MVLVTKDIIERLPCLGSQDGKPPTEVKVAVKFFDPTGSWTWYVVEGEQRDLYFGTDHTLADVLAQPL